MVRFTLLEAGFCTHREHMLIQGGSRDVLQIPALVGLIEHPSEGPILYDTGYSHRFHAETARFPASLYARLTPVHFHDQDAVATQLEARGIRTENVRTIIISHFHADHIGALKDFPNARFVCSGAAYQVLKRRRGVSALRSGFLPGLLPPDFAQRTWFIEDLPESPLPAPYAPFLKGRDLFGDGSVTLVELPGHALGHYGAVVNADPPIFLVGDAVWVSRSIRENRPPHALAHILFPDKTQYRETLLKLHQLYQARPDLLIVPSHCSEHRNRLVTRLETPS